MFFLTDGSPILFSDFVRSLLTASGVENVDEAMSRSLPLWAARKLGQVAEFLGKKLQNVPHMTEAGIGLIGQEMTILDKKARTVIGFESRTTLEQGFDEIYKQHLRNKAKQNLGREI